VVTTLLEGVLALAVEEHLRQVITQVEIILTTAVLAVTAGHQA
jgi:hypothetical protein